MYVKPPQSIPGYKHVTPAALPVVFSISSMKEVYAVKFFSVKFIALD